MDRVAHQRENERRFDVFDVQHPVGRLRGDDAVLGLVVRVIL